MAGAQRDAVLRLWLDGRPFERSDRWVLQVEVDERTEDASTFRIVLDLSPVDGPDGGDWDLLERGRFAQDLGLPDVGLMRRVTIGFGLTGGDSGAPDVDEIVLDGYVTAVEAVLGESRVPDSSLVLTGTDAMCLMHLSTATREWYGLSDSDIAGELFGKYGFASGPASVEATTPIREQSRASMVQRGTDAQFLRLLAQRNGYELFLEPVQGEVRPGSHPTTSVTGHFHAARPGAEPQPVLELFPREAPTVIEMRARWDSHAGSRWRGWHIDEVSRRLQQADVTDPGYLRMGSHSRGQFLATRLAEIAPVRAGTAVPGTAGDGAGAPSGDAAVQVLDVQSAAVPHSGAELLALTRAAYRSSDWFATAHATVRGERYPAILRSRRPVALAGAGHLLDGTWYAQGVRHRWGVDPAEPHREQTTTRYEADVTLVRNALGGMP
ncbi:hypothetical protein [Micromonospora sp. CB01531]|uniref:hypothetical protein n=1 Tax=Micromonospora sp. CB01531 TaxID=1718947 RepID=UPI00093BE3F6|nr:hypothetical protein [Micromonospora sp. CB01531]OKI51395.1 hypothetical protein A6A27_33515 [Micromonospora sp. CB01531]